MKITRLDKIIENNIAFSTHHKPEDQAVYILQDISETLAMIYDHLCGEAPVSQASESVATMAYIIPFDELKNYNKMHFDHIDFPKGYEISFIRYELFTTQDKITLENIVKRFAVVNAFGHEMKLEEKEYGTKWRCWNVEPTEEERGKVKWGKQE